jgi:hypothetical protein
MHPAPVRPRRLTVARLLSGAGLAVMLLVLPFVALLRGSSYFYLQRGSSTWVAVGLGAVIALGIVALYGSWISKRLTGRARFWFISKWVATPLVIIYCLHGLLFLSRVNAKSERVRSYYTNLHPLLRLAVSTFVIIDGDLVITDLARQPRDYRAMGLPVAERSMHYVQRDGYAHAMDLRTGGRSSIRNWATAGYFRMLGFRVLRHVGTADHLHISLPVPAQSQLAADTRN